MKLNFAEFIKFLQVLFFYDNNIMQNLSGLLNEVLSTLVAQGASKLREVKFEGRKKLPYAAPMWVNLLDET